MITAISNLEPKSLWNIFEEITNIPRPSDHEEKIADFIINFAKTHNLKWEQDAIGNVIVDIEATEDKKHSPCVILQGHMDMVAVVENGYEHDFLNAPIEAYVDNEKIRAKHTTLGADNGIAIAMMLSLVKEQNLSHGPLRFIFTVCEETSMKGALNLDKKYLQGDYLINLDSEDNGYLFVACAGSADINIKFNYEAVKTENTKAITFNLTGFKGGHSGADIHLGRANAIKLLAAILNNLSDNFDFFIQDIQGGTVRNSIPAKASVTVAVDVNQFDEFKNAFKQQFDKQRKIYEDTDPALDYTTASATVTEALATSQTLDLIHLLQALPDGVAKISPIYEGNIIQTSINTGVVTTEKNCVNICLLPRSLSNLELEEMINKVVALCDLVEEDLEVEVSNQHQAWCSPKENKLIDVLTKTYKQETSQELKITALHAGVECAQFAALTPQLQLVSIGPTIEHPHSIEESLDIKGTKEIYSTLVRALAML